ncbi:MAG: hypothetical protein WCO45_10895 [Pseudanabaena sp. ELA607]|jgi:hypothetical protein
MIYHIKAATWRMSQHRLIDLVLGAATLGALILPWPAAALAESSQNLNLEATSKIKQTNSIIINRSSNTNRTSTTNQTSVTIRDKKPAPKKPRNIIYKLPAGQAITTRFLGQSTLYIAGGATVNDVNLEVSQNVVNSKGIILIPAGAVISGQFVPIPGGSKFVAQNLSSRGATIGIVAESPLLADMKDPRETNTGAIATDAAIGGASGAVLGTVMRGSLKVEDIVGGAVAGAVIGNITAPQVTVIEPQATVVVKTLQEVQFMVKGK